MKLKLLIGIAFLPLFLFGQNQSKLEKSLFEKDMIKANKLLDAKVKKGDSSLLANLAFTFSRLHKDEKAYKYYLLADAKGNAFNAKERIDFLDLARSRSANSQIMEKHIDDLKKVGYEDANESEPSFFSTANIQPLCFNTKGDEFGFLPLGKLNIVSATYYNLTSAVENSTVKTYQTGVECSFAPFNINGLPNIDSKIHQGPAYVSSDAKWVFMTVSRENPNYNGEFNLDVVYTRKIENNRYVKYKRLPFSNDSFSIQHPYFDEKNNCLYFSSNKPGGKGGFDIYKTTWNGSTWQTPIAINLINTAANEVFPFIGKNGNLFYAGKPLNGFGGLDLLIYKWDNNKPQLLPPPINSAYDDFGISFHSVIKGYFVSNRPGGKGGDDIYVFDLDTLPYRLKIIVVDSITKQPLANVSFEPINGNFNNSTYYSNTIGQVSLQFPSYQNGLSKFISYKLQMEGYNAFLLEFTQEFKKIKNLEYYCYLTVKPKLLPTFKVGDDIGKILSLKPIYFELNKALITPLAAVELDKVVKLMQENPGMVIELGSHTDSRSSAKYNLSLSQKRANSSANYIISKGIDKRRLSKIGYGETKLLNECSDGVPCSNEMHALNRRTEFIIVKMQ